MRVKVSDTPFVDIAPIEYHKAVKAIHENWYRLEDRLVQVIVNRSTACKGNLPLTGVPTENNPNPDHQSLVSI
jgi:hypothetical protein